MTPEPINLTELRAEYDRLDANNRPGNKLYDRERALIATAEAAIAYRRSHMRDDPSFQLDRNMVKHTGRQLDESLARYTTE